MSDSDAKAMPRWGEVPAESEENELEILMPDQTLTLGTGDTVTVHEYRFMEGLQVDALAGAMIKRLQDLFLAAEDAPHTFRLQDLAAVFGEQPKIMAALIALACSRDQSWVESLSDQDGQLLMLTWWNVNRSFFVRRLVTELGARRALHQAGAASSPDSSATATAGKTS